MCATATSGGPAVAVPEPGQDVEITIRGRVKRIGGGGRAVLVVDDSGAPHWFELPDDRLTSVTWKEAS